MIKKILRELKYFFCNDFVFDEEKKEVSKYEHLKSLYTPLYLFLLEVGVWEFDRRVLVATKSMNQGHNEVLDYAHDLIYCTTLDQLLDATDHQVKYIEYTLRVLYHNVKNMTE